MQQAGIGVLGVAIASGIYWLVKKVTRPTEENEKKPQQEDSPQTKQNTNEKY